MHQPQIQGRILDLERYRVQKKIENKGFTWHENKKNKVTIWIRLNKDQNPDGTLNSTRK